MVSLESPLLTLGALYLAGQDERGRQFTGGESGRGLLAGGFAASSSNYLVDQARSLTGLQSDALTDELAQALIGAGISRFGDPIPMNNAMARGIHYNVADDAFTKAGITLGDIAGDVTNGGSGAPSGGGGGSGATHNDMMNGGGSSVVANKRMSGNTVTY